jgi:hypothetical protein
MVIYIDMKVSVTVVSSIGDRDVGGYGAIWLSLWGLNNLYQLELWVLGFNVYCLGFGFVDFKGWF